MKFYVSSLTDRQRRARYLRERYAKDPAFRLKVVNKGRRYRGLPPHSSIDEIKPRSEFRREIAAKQPRQPNGRFA